MILKDKDTKIHIDIESTDLHSGLGDDDRWCHTVFHVYNNEIEFNIDNCILTYQEVVSFKMQLLQFMDGKFKSKRIAFIKNFLIAYLSIRGGKKNLKLRFVHVGTRKKNYSLQLEEDEINMFIGKLNIN